jgi:hypothetical protein
MHTRTMRGCGVLLCSRRRISCCCFCSTPSISFSYTTSLRKSAASGTSAAVGSGRVLLILASSGT